MKRDTRVDHAFGRTLFPRNDLPPRYVKVATERPTAFEVSPFSALRKTDWHGAYPVLRSYERAKVGTLGHEADAKQNLLK